MELRTLLRPITRQLERTRDGVWAIHGRAHVEVHLSEEEMERVRQDLEGALQALAGVDGARVYCRGGRVGGGYREGEQTPRALAERVRAFERGHAEGPEARVKAHPGDAEPVRRNLVELGAGIASLGVGMLLRMGDVERPKINIDLAAVLSLVDSMPTVRRVLERRFGPGATDLALSLLGSMDAAALQATTGPAVEMGRRGLRLWEIGARSELFEALEPELCGRPELHEEGACRLEPRPQPIPPGPVESYAEKAVAASLGGFGLAFGSTSSFAAASMAVFGGLPKPARLGREAFSLGLGAHLARRGVLVLTPTAVARLDRIDCVVIHGELLEPVALSADGETVGRAVPPEARALVRAVRNLRARLVVYGGSGAGWEWAEPDEIVPAEARPEKAVRRLQSAGRVVAFVGRGPREGLRAADLGIGLWRSGAQPPWEAHLICRDLRQVWLVLDAVQSARRVSKQSVRLAMVEAATTGLLAFEGVRARTTRRVMGVANGISLVAMANGLYRAKLPEAIPFPSLDALVPWHAYGLEEAFARLGSSASGRAARGGAAPVGGAPFGGPGGGNGAPEVSLLAAVVEELRNPLTPILAGGAGLSAVLGSWVDTSLVVSVIGLNGLIGGLQRTRSDRALAALFHREERKVRVRRPREDGGFVLEELDALGLTPGDVVELDTGEVVPADCRVVEATSLEVDESALTGESLPVKKGSEPSRSPLLAEQASMLFQGTTIASGNAVALVVRVGDATEARRALLETASEKPAGGVEHRLHELSQLTLPLVAASGFLLVGIGAARGRSMKEVLGPAVSLAVAAVPEGLPILATTAQLSAARRLAAKGALVRNPRALEALGRVNVVCADKTGTLTEGTLRLRMISDGVTAKHRGELGEAHRRVLSVALRAMPNNGQAQDGQAQFAHATDQALADGAREQNVTESGDGDAWVDIDEIPFESGRGFHANLGELEGERLISIKGAPEAVLPRCVRWHRDGETGALGEEERRHLEAEVERLAGRGFRLLAVAEKPANGHQHIPTEALEELTFLGFLGLADPVRPTAKKALEDLRAAGVRVVMLTGDHPTTAGAIAEELGLPSAGEPVTGAEMEALEDEALLLRLEQTAIVARITPRQKTRIVRALQGAGRVVAMTGDGTNDAPALRLADAGVALGERATSSAREAADVVVTDGRIETLVEAVFEGRALWSSVRDAVSILVGGNLGEVAYTTAGTLISGTPPLNARQLLLVNLLTDALPAMAIAVRPPAKEEAARLLGEGPEASLGGALNRALAWRAAITSSAAIGAYLAARLTGSRKSASTVGLVALVGAQMGQTLVAGKPTWPVVAASMGTLAAVLALVETPGLNRFFGCRTLGPLGLAEAAVAMSLATGLAWVAPKVVESKLVPWLGEDPLEKVAAWMRKDPRLGPIWAAFAAGEPEKTPSGGGDEVLREARGEEPRGPSNGAPGHHPEWSA